MFYCLVIFMFPLFIMIDSVRLFYQDPIIVVLVINKPKYDERNHEPYLVLIYSTFIVIQRQLTRQQGCPVERHLQPMLARMPTELGRRLRPAPVTATLVGR